MAEALAALGIACNVLAVVDFTWTLLTEAREIYKADTGASDNVIFLENIVNDIKDHDDRLAESNTNDKKLKKLVEESRVITSQLSAALKSMKSEGRRSKWKGFKVALKDVWGDSKVKSLAEKVGSLQSQVTRHVLMSISDEVKQTGSDVKVLSAAISRLEKTDTRLGIKRKEDLNQLEETFAKAVRDAALITRNDLERLCRAIVHEDEVIFVENQRPGQIMTAAKELSEAADFTQKDQEFLETLHFERRINRHYNIEDAHRKTFEWILQDDSPKMGQSTIGFKQWLERGSGVYWISGKPGSGKSTLMKFLSDNEKTKQCLMNWACGQPLVTAKYYFWNAGTALQKSQEGLLRSIIFELLRNCPDLIPVARRALSIGPSYAQHSDQWEVNDLLSMYTAVVTHDMHIKFCLFIDGLDEFEDESRTQRDLLNTIRRLNNPPNVKLCLSSRPWTEFVDEFGNDGNHLRLEDLTRGDIQRYVTDHFKANSQFDFLNAHNDAYAKFVQSVLDRAQGVFLWVFLVMRELLQGLTQHDSVKTLQARLDRYPPDLEKFFRLLINHVNPVYQKQMAQYFFVAVSSFRPLPARYYSFMDDLEDMVTPAVDASLHQFSDEEKMRRENQLRRRLDGRTRGLLELKCSEQKSQDVSRFWNSEVEFLHRTVRDFLHNSRDIQELFDRELSDGPPFLKACKAILISWTTYPYDGGNDSLRKEVEWADLSLFASFCHHSTPDRDTELQNIIATAEEADNHLRSLVGDKSQPRDFLQMTAAVGLHDYSKFIRQRRRKQRSSRRLCCWF